MRHFIQNLHIMFASTEHMYVRQQAVYFSSLLWLFVAALAVSCMGTTATAAAGTSASAMLSIFTGSIYISSSMASVSSANS